MIVATIHIEMQVVDHGEPRTRVTTGSPLASKEASAALIAAESAAEEAVKAAGFQVLGVGYGVTAEEYA